MIPRQDRWLGSLGLYFPGAGYHWQPHNGIARGVLEEGQQHFRTTEDALAWLQQRRYMEYVYNSNGLVVGWAKTLERKQLTVEVWQLYVGGKKPTSLPGADDAAIVVSR